MTAIDHYTLLLDWIWDWDGVGYVRVPGADLQEWLALVQSDWDDVDRLYTEYETIGA